MSSAIQFNEAARRGWQHGGFDKDAAMRGLVASFHTLSEYPSEGPFEALRFQRWAKHTQSSGGLHAARFVLSLWNPSGRWAIGRFDLVHAMGVWDPSMRESFLAWAQSPWWP